MKKAQREALETEAPSKPKQQLEDLHDWIDD